MLHASSDADRMVCLADRDGCKIVTSIGVIFLQLRPISSGFWKSKIEGPKNYFQMSFLVLASGRVAAVGQPPKAWGV